MTQLKGTHILAECLPELLTKFPEMLVVFIGGDAVSPDGGSMRQYILQRAGSRSDQVRLIQPMRHELLYVFLKRARVVALPSLVDNIPNTCLEAMGHGAIVVATSGSCFEFLISHGVSGLLVAPGSPTQLSEMIARRLEDAGGTASRNGRASTAARQFIATRGYGTETYRILPGCDTALPPDGDRKYRIGHE